mgnify:CR=1 FL=1
MDLKEIIQSVLLFTCGYISFIVLSIFLNY